MFEFPAANLITYFASWQPCCEVASDSYLNYLNPWKTTQEMEFHVQIRSTLEVIHLPAVSSEDFVLLLKIEFCNEFM